MLEKNKYKVKMKDSTAECLRELGMKSDDDPFPDHVKVRIKMAQLDRDISSVHRNQLAYWILQCMCRVRGLKTRITPRVLMERINPVFYGNEASIFKGTMF